MATAHPPRRWADLLHPSEALLGPLKCADQQSVSLIRVGTAWDTVTARWEAITITPLERGLAALDALAVPLDGEHPVFADYLRSELIVLVPEGEAAAAVNAHSGLQGVRALTTSTWLVVPHGPHGGWAAAWLNRPTPYKTRYVDPARLCETVLTAETARQ